MYRNTVRALPVLLALAVLPALASEGRTPIPFTDPYVTPQPITTPGSYVVTRNLAPAALGGPIITIDCTAPDFLPATGAVTIDLNGFTLDQTADPTIPVIEVISTPLCEVLIRNGEILGGATAIAVPAGARKVLIEDVEIKDTASVAIFLFDPETFVIRRNVVVAAGGPGIVVAGGLVKSGTIEENIIQKCVDMGISVEAASGVEISNNRIHEIFGAAFPFGAGIFLFDTHACLVSENLIEEVFGVGLPESGQGLRLEDSTCKLYNNVINSVDGDGIFLDAGTGNCLVLDNNVSESGRDGIHVEGFQNHIDRNLFNDNGFAFGGFGIHFVPPSFANRSGRNSAVGNAGPAPLCVTATVGGFPDYCDDVAPPGFVNVSFGDNLVPVIF